MDKSLWKKMEEQVKRGLLIDKGLNVFLEPVFPNTKDRKIFIKKCLKKMVTRRMLLRAQWYTEIVDDQVKIRQNRPALQLIFLLSLAEAIAKQRTRNMHQKSFTAIREFFKFILKKDEATLRRGFRRTLSILPISKFRFSSILKILYNVRNNAVHGEDYYSFSLMDKEEKKKHSHYTSYSLITSGFLGTKKNKRRVSLETGLTYEELRDIFRRTAIENIRSLL